MPEIGFQELLLILIICLLVFGAKRLPEMGASIGKGIREFKRSLSDVQRSVEDADDSAALPPPRRGDVTTPRSGEAKKLSQ